MEGEDISLSGSFKDTVAMHHMRCSFFFTAFHQLVLAPQNLPGSDNIAADCLSRDGLYSFGQLVLNAHPQPMMSPIIIPTGHCRNGEPHFILLCKWPCRLVTEDLQVCRKAILDLLLQA